VRSGRQYCAGVSDATFKVTGDSQHGVTLLQLDDHSFEGIVLPLAEQFCFTPAAAVAALSSPPEQRSRFMLDCASSLVAHRLEIGKMMSAQAVRGLAEHCQVATLPAGTIRECSCDASVV
jgi:hypothetical protein